MTAVLRRSLLAATFLLVALPQVCLVSSFCFSAVFTKKSSSSTVVPAPVAQLLSPRNTRRQRTTTSAAAAAAACDDVDALTQHPAVTWDESVALSSTRKKLKPRHLSLFETTSSSSSLNNLSNNNHNTDGKLSSFWLFDEFASVVCRTGTVSRKEVFETWAAALFIHERFFGTTTRVSSSSLDCDLRRVADVAGGHGLLAWALLILDDHQQQHHEKTLTDSEEDVPMPRRHHRRPLTAFCLDSKMPKSADVIYTEMLHRWPQLQGRFDFVEANLEQLRPDPSCLLASVHACGGLSDLLVATAVSSKAPIAVVPCCHSRKNMKFLEVIAAASLHANEEYQAIVDVPSDQAFPDLADRLDEARITALRKAGFDVRADYLPELFTGKTRLISGVAPPPWLSEEERQVAATIVAADSPNHNDSVLDRGTDDNRKLRVGRMAPLSNDKPIKRTAKQTFLQKFHVPCQDTPEARAVVQALSGRAAANRRREALHRRNHADAPELDLSIWLPNTDNNNNSTSSAANNMKWEEALVKLVHRSTTTAGLKLRCTVSQVGSAFFQPSSGRTAVTFRFAYYKETSTDDNNNNNSLDPLSNDQAKSIHDQLATLIPVAFPGAVCR
jgi:hypothetical protein